MDLTDETLTAGVTLRPARFEDYAVVAKLHTDNWRRHYRGILSDRFLDNELEKDRLETWHNRLKTPDDNQLTTLIFVNGEIAGFSCVLLNNDAMYGSLIDNLHVVFEHQKKGIGKIMIGHCASAILKLAAKKMMYLWVYEANNNARLAYHKWGGINMETVLHENVDGTRSPVCRYFWSDLKKFEQPGQK